MGQRALLIALAIATLHVKGASGRCGQRRGHAC
jgi:hypothetical protein